ncbi:anthranilate synthase component I family protein [Brevundimonas lutea]|uniref:anthranilate synthase component I family protein n=1 Tax=Brevundimonas lutea TaxID=2293980 RepID=UPI001F0C9590|nr:anthranilate synthase component I family protein [Brevundimonas lutea]
MTSPRPAHPYARLAWREAGFWRDPAELAGAMDAAGLDGAAVLLSDGGPQARWSYALARPDAVETIDRGGLADFVRLRPLLGDTPPAASTPDDFPPFTGGVLGLAAYDLGDGRAGDWPALTLARYSSLLAFDHRRRRILAVARGAADAAAAARVEATLSWLDLPPAPARPFAGAELEPEASPAAYVAAVTDVIARIDRGDLYQANIARVWTAILADRPVALFRRLAAASPAPFAAWLDLGERQLVSNSPELFLSLTVDGDITARPIKGTRPRRSDPEADAAEASELRASVKDRAENLMIVDLMRNDLARVARPGSVTVPALFEVEPYANVHHLVSEVRAQLAPERDAADVLAATFPPGSITGAPKRMAMSVIREHEPPRGPWCGSLFLAGFDGSLSASVLIRTVAATREGDVWRLRTQAGAGIVADSIPKAELAETEAKIAAIRRALSADQSSSVTTSDTRGRK